MSEEVTLDTSNFLSNPATCVACDSSEGTKYASFRLSCGHSLCSVHFAEVSTSRGCSTSYCCPRLSCGQLCKSVEVVQLEAHEKRTRNNSSKLFARERSEWGLYAAFALILFAVTNRFKCIRIVVDILVHWECSSEADQVFYDEFVFTAKTGNLHGQVHGMNGHRS